MTAIIAELEIPSNQVAMSATLTQFEEITFDVQEIVAHGDVVSPFVWVSGVGVDPLESAFDADPSVGSYRQLTEKSDGSVLYEMEWSRDADVVLRLIEEAGAVLHATGETDRWFLRLLFPTHEALSRSYEQCRREGLAIDVVRVYRPEDGDGGDSFLTDDQRVTVVEAFERGYYDIPRRTTLSELAGSRGTSHQSLSEQLRRAHRNLIGTYVVGGGRGDQHDSEE
jgi:hypothetical protein